MATGGSVLADLETAKLTLSIPDEFIQACWYCQDIMSLDIATERGQRCLYGKITIDNTAALGVIPDESVPGQAVAIYDMSG